MNAEALDLWQRAGRTLKTAASLVQEDPDSAASRAYYSAFHAVSALFALSGKSFKKHSGVEAAVHRDLVKSGAWGEDLGKDYSWLSSLRFTADYGGGKHVSIAEAQESVRRAETILEAVRKVSPQSLP